MDLLIKNSHTILDKLNKSDKDSTIDDTQANGNIPQTGVNGIVIISSILTLIVLATIAVIQLNKYKGIK